MNTFKKLIIKILCCAIVCAAIIPDVYGMKRKADSTDTADEKSAKRQKNAQDDSSSNGNGNSGSDASPSSNSHSGEAKQEAKQAGKAKNIFLKLRDAELGKKFSRHNVYDWVRNLPTQIGEREKAETIVQLILAHYTMPDFKLLEWFELLPPGREEGNARSRLITLLDKKIKQIVADLTADLPPVLLFVDDSVGHAYAERLKKVDENARKFVSNLPMGYVRTMIQYYLFTQHQIETPQRYKIWNIFDRTLKRFEGQYDRRCYTRGSVDLSNLNITSFDEVAEILAVHDQQEPITRLDLSTNKLTSATIPACLAKLWNLDLSHNKLTTYTGPFRAGFALYLQGNNLLDPEKERIRGLSKDLMHVSL